MVGVVRGGGGGGWTCRRNWAAALPLLLPFLPSLLPARQWAARADAVVVAQLSRCAEGLVSVGALTDRRKQVSVRSAYVSGSSQFLQFTLDSASVLNEAPLIAQFDCRLPSPCHVRVYALSQLDDGATYYVDERGFQRRTDSGRDPSCHETTPEFWSRRYSEMRKDPLRSFNARFWVPFGWWNLDSWWVHVRSGNTTRYAIQRSLSLPFDLCLSRLALSTCGVVQFSAAYLSPHLYVLYYTKALSDIDASNASTPRAPTNTPTAPTNTPAGSHAATSAPARSHAETSAPTESHPDCMLCSLGSWALPSTLHCAQRESVDADGFCNDPRCMFNLYEENARHATSPAGQSSSNNRQDKSVQHWDYNDTHY